MESFAVTNDRGFIAQKDAHDEFGYMSNVDRTAYNIVPPQSFAYNPARINVGSLGYYAGGENVIVSSLYEVFQTEDYIDDRFLWHWLKSEHFPKWIEKLQEGSVRLYFYFDKLIQCQLMVPSYEEQQRISAYLDSIDHLITLHQRQKTISIENNQYVWEQRKLGDISSLFEYGLNAAAKEYDGVNKYIRITDIDDDSRIFVQNDLTSPDCDLSCADRYKLEEGDIVFARTGASVGKTYIYKALDGLVYYAGFLIRAKIKSDYSADFVFYNTLTKKYEKFINITSQRSGQPGVNAQEYASFEMMTPKIEEQRKIGEYFSNLDHLITLHQCKCQIIRFMCLNDWEQRKVSEITTSYSGGTPQAGNPEYYNGDIPFIRSGEINEEQTELFITKKGMNNSSAKMVSEGDILYALYGATSGEVSRAKLAGAINQAILAIDPNENCNADFLVEWFRREKENITDKYLQGGQGNLSAQIIKNLEIEMPSFVEQEKIGEYFSRINHLITLHQCKCQIIRFKCLNDWGQRKFGKLVEKYEDPVETPTDGYMRLGIRSHAKGTFHSYVEKGRELETAKMFRVAANSFIVNITFGWEHAVAITDENDAGKLVSHRFPQYQFRNGMIPKFFRYLILDECFKHHLELIRLEVVEEIVF